MSHNVQTLDSALQAIAAERAALKAGRPSSFAEVPTSAVPERLPLPPMPRATGLVNGLPTNLQSVTRLDVPPPQNENFQNLNRTGFTGAAPAGTRKKFPSFLLAGNVALSLVVGIGAASFIGMVQGNSAASGGSFLAAALGKSDLSSKMTAVDKQNRISAADSARLNRSCTVLYQDLLTGHTKSTACHRNTGMAGRTEVTQFSSAQTSAKINPNKFRESLSTSGNKITESLSAASPGRGVPAFKGTGDSQGLALKLKPRGIVKRFYKK